MTYDSKVKREREREIVRERERAKREKGEIENKPIGTFEWRRREGETR